MYLYLTTTNNREFTGKSSLTLFCAESSEKKLCWFHELKSVVKVKIAQNNSQVSEGGITVKPSQDSVHELINWNSESVCRFCYLYPVSNCIQMICEFLTAIFSIRWDGKYFNESNFYLKLSSNSRKLSRQKFNNELACVFTAPCASKNADWNQQELTDGGILANRNSANHPYCFLSSQKEVHLLAFLHVICGRTVSKTDYRYKGRGHDRRLGRMGVCCSSYYVHYCRYFSEKITQ